MLPPKNAVTPAKEAVEKRLQCGRACFETRPSDAPQHEVIP
jgi:hypothetical protein